MMDGGFQFFNAFAGVGTDFINMFSINSGINEQIPTALNITIGEISFADHPKGGNIIREH